jgi:hypothetical protein
MVKSIVKRKTMKRKGKGRARVHRGGSHGNTGYTFNQQDVIGGQMARVGYSHCDNPEYYNKFQVYDVPIQDQSAAKPMVEGQGHGQVGGKRRKHSKKHSSKKSKKSSKRHNKSRKH